MRVKGLEAVCKRSLQFFREGPVVLEAEELQRRIQVASTEERPRRLKCTVLYSVTLIEQLALDFSSNCLYISFAILVHCFVLCMLTLLVQL